jgi:hypothetical protein
MLPQILDFASRVLRAQSWRTWLALKPIPSRTKIKQINFEVSSADGTLLDASQIQWYDNDPDDNIPLLPAARSLDWWHYLASRWQLSKIMMCSTFKCWTGRELDAVNVAYSKNEQEYSLRRIQHSNAELDMNRTPWTWHVARTSKIIHYDAFNIRTLNRKWTGRRERGM